MATFSARARTLAMLGRQQIAGIPTAISELFKNAHDAYAKTVEVDYYRSDGLLVLRDDGIGMSPDDFSQYWLTIGTDSKLVPVPDRPRPSGFDERPMLGEKGIGRLSIAAIGPQVLVMTRAWQPHGSSDLTVAFVNWSIFEWPAVTLHDVEVPVRIIEGGRLPTSQDVDAMVAAFWTNGDRLRDKVPSENIERLEHELNQFQVDPQELDSYCPQLSLRDNASGTHFVLLPTSPLIPEDIDGSARSIGSRGTTTATPLQKALLGFANTMTPDASPPVIQTAFRDHKTDDYFDDLVSDGEFFTIEEFRNADHQFVGTFDDFGQFTGEIRIYGEPIERHVVPWGNPRRRKTRCGPFRIGFAAVERKANASTLPADDHVRMTQKLNMLGGLYIYRDGIRIQPYGDTTYDWLDIEYRRSKGAGHYYFSHRKMFGAVELTSRRNTALKEKAGREGFMENAGYREFKDILKSFLQTVAANFFRDEGTYAAVYTERRLEFDAMHKAEQRRRQQVRVQRQRLSTDLDAFFVAVADGKPTSEVEEVAEKLDIALQSLPTQESHERAAMVQRLETQANHELRDIKERYRIIRPRVSLTKATRTDWERYRTKYIDLSTTVFDPARQLLDSLVDGAIGSTDGQRRARAEVAMKEVSDEISRRTRSQRHTVVKKAETVLESVRREARSRGNKLEDELRHIWAAFYSTDLSTHHAAEFVTALTEAESKMTEAGELAMAGLHRMELHLDAVAVEGRDSPMDQLVAVEQRNQSLEERLAMDLHLAQVGMAVEIINHEFGTTVRTLRNSLRQLKAWADTNPELRVLYNHIRTSFDHLDGYLKMFTPLQRRLYRTRIDIRGSELAMFLKDLFRARLERHQIVLDSTRAFLNTKLRSYPSSFYPVFVNLVDNAIYWLSIGINEKHRRIVLDADGERLLVTDNGPGITERDREHIFEFGYTRKPGGRGMGLHIARETLRQVDYRIDVVSTPDATGTTFAVEPAHD